MKTLKGLNSSFSAFENNKLKNLKVITGGNGDPATEKSRTESVSSGPNCSEYSIEFDSGKTGSIEICTGEVAASASAE